MQDPIQFGKNILSKEFENSNKAVECFEKKMFERFIDKLNAAKRSPHEPDAERKWSDSDTGQSGPPKTLDDIIALCSECEQG